MRSRFLMYIIILWFFSQFLISCREAPYHNDNKEATETSDTINSYNDEDNQENENNEENHPVQFTVSGLTIENTINTGDSNTIVKNGELFYYAGGADQTDNLGVINFSDPANPIIEGTYATGVGHSYGIATDGRYVFIQTDGGAVSGLTTGFASFDFKDHASINLSCFTLAGHQSAYSVKYHNGYLVSPSDFVVAIHNVVDPTNMVLVSTIGTNNARWCEIEGDSLYFVDNSEFKIYDITNKAAPTAVSNYTIECYSLAKKDQFVYIGGNNKLLTILNISDPLNITNVGSLTLSGAISRNIYGEMKIRGNYLFVANEKYFWVLDISDPVNISEIDRISFTNSGWGFDFYNDDYVLVCDQTHVKVVKINH